MGESRIHRTGKVKPVVVWRPSQTGAVLLNSGCDSAAKQCIPKNFTGLQQIT